MVMYRLAVTFLVIRESFLTATVEFASKLRAAYGSASTLVLLAIIRAFGGIGNVGAEDLAARQSCRVFGLALQAVWSPAVLSSGRVAHS
jgi:hypothetical protein